jgi:hypothetical protein
MIISLSFFFERQIISLSRAIGIDFEDVKLIFVYFGRSHFSSIIDFKLKLRFIVFEYKCDFYIKFVVQLIFT